MIKKIFQNKESLMVFGFITIISLIFCIEKYGYFIDEIFTLGCANSHYAPFISMINGGSINNTIIDKSDFLRFLSVANGERFDFGSVYYNLSFDTQPPLYYWLLNICSSFFQNVFSKWICLGLNFILFWITLLFLFKICKLLKMDNTHSLICVIFLGLSNSLMSNLLYIRMYILLVCLSMILAYLFVLYRQIGKMYICALILIVLFLGAMTQYIFLVFAFFLSAIYIFYFLMNKKWAKAVLLGLSSLLGVLLLVIAFPTVLNIIFSDGSSVSGVGMFDKLKSVLIWPISIISGAKALITGTFISFSVLLCVVSMIIIHRKNCFEHLKFKENTDIYLLSIVALLTFVLVTIISPYASSLNYISNTAFIIPLLATYLLSKYQILSSIKAFNKSSKNMILIAMIFMMVSIFVIEPNYINDSFKEFDSKLEPYCNAPCVYYQEENRNAPMSQDMAQLVRFNNVFVTDGKNNYLASNYINSQSKTDELIVYIEVDAVEKGLFSPNEIINYYLDEMDYSSYKLLYSFNHSECYVFNK